MTCRKTLAATAGVTLLVWSASAQGRQPNRWVEVRRDALGARRGSAIRYVPEADAFFLWGFFDYDRNLLQEHPLMETPEYDVVFFDPDQRVWRNSLPRPFERESARKLPLAYVPRTYFGITTGSERTVMRGTTGDAEGVPRPDLNIAFDQVAYDPGLKALVYFTGGLTAAYNISERRWTDLAPAHSPPPVLGGSLAYDPVNREVVLFGGGFVAERNAAGAPAGYTGTWLLAAGDWRRLPTKIEPPPRLNTRLVCNVKNQLLIVFGGDGQSRYLSDTWLYDLKTRMWRKSQAPAGPAARAGHFTVYDAGTGWVIIGGGYNTRDLTDMWAYDAAQDRWLKIPGEVPVGFYITADIAPERHSIVLVANSHSTHPELYFQPTHPMALFTIPRIKERVRTTAGVLPLLVNHRAVKPALDAATAEEFHLLVGLFVVRFVEAIEEGDLHRFAPQRIGIQALRTCLAVSFYTVS